MTKLQQLDNDAILAEEFQVPTGEVESQSFKLSSGHWVLMAVALLSIFFIAFITIARSIQITIVTAHITKADTLLPLNAEVDFASKIKIPLGNRILVLPGTHKININAEGFASVNQDLVVGTGRNQEFEIVLRPLPGQLDVTLTPAIAANVSLRGELIGELPGLLEKIPAGQHEIVIDAPLYRAVTRSIIVRGRGQTESIAVTLVPAWGDLSVTSLPSEARVLIDDEEVGRTPLQLKVEEGTHTLSLIANKFKPFTQNFTMLAQQTLQVAEVQLIPADGILEIETVPTQAAIILNGEYRGVSPISLKLKPDQQQKVQIYKSGFRLQTEQISLAPDQLDKRQISLKQDVVAVRFSISPGSLVSKRTLTIWLFDFVGIISF